MIDYRIRLIILSPRLSRYRSLDKGLKTGPGAVLVVSTSIFAIPHPTETAPLEEWLRKSSGINQKYFEGEVYKDLRSRIKNSSRYARSEFKDTVRTRAHL